MKIIDKTKGTVKTAAVPATSTKKKSTETKARKMGASEKVKILKIVIPCGICGNPLQRVLFTDGRNGHPKAPKPKMFCAVCIRVSV